MRRATIIECLALLIAGGVTLFSTSSARAGVVWTFYETTCAESPTGPPCPTSPNCNSFYCAPPLPFAAAQLDLFDIDSSDTFSYTQFEDQPPVETGDTDFSFMWGGTIEAPTAPDSVCFFSPGFVSGCQWNIRWASTATTLSISVDYKGGLNDNIDIGERGGMIGSDGTMPGCGMFAECTITGYWTLSSAPLPEPSSLASLAAGALMAISLCVARRKPPTTVRADCRDKEGH
ncbi:MAG: PEP-CTERM sorting domain-containing protein [Stellaceae bacterium]